MSFEEMEEFEETEEIEETIEFKDKRLPVLKVDDHYCLLSIDRVAPAPEEIPDGLHCYDIRSAGKSTGPLFQVEKSVPDLYRWGRIFCKDELPLGESGSYYPTHTSALHMAGDPPTVKEFLALSEESLAKVKDDGLLHLSGFGLIPVYPILDIYREYNNLYLGLNYYDEEEQMFDHYGDVTVNVEQMQYQHSTIDTNNNGTRILDFLKRNGFGEETNRCVNSGFCSFPVFRFDDRALQRIDPRVYKDYAMMHGHDPARLDEKIHEATARVGEPAAHKGSIGLSRE